VTAGSSLAHFRLPAIFALVPRRELGDAVTETTREPQPALAGTN
jgi:hypothetical protein